MREDKAEKAGRYLMEGRLTVDRADERVLEATCRGSGAVYELGWNGSEWHCTCPSFGRCSHLLALQLVTVAP